MDIERNHVVEGIKGHIDQRLEPLDLLVLGLIALVALCLLPNYGHSQIASQELVLEIGLVSTGCF